MYIYIYIYIYICIYIYIYIRNELKYPLNRVGALLVADIVKLLGVVDKYV